MRSEAEMFELILRVGQALPQVEAIALGGSRSNPAVPRDAFQDYDVVYLVNDKEALLQDRSWLESFGEVLIQQTPEESRLFPPSLGERFTFLMLFKDGNRIDLMLTPLTAIKEWQADEPFAKALWDPKGLLKDLPTPSDHTFWLSEPNNAQFQDCCNEFWWVTTYVVKGLCRKEYYYASDHLYEICQKELRRLLAWQVGSEDGWQQSLGKNDKYLLQKLTPELGAKLLHCQDFSSPKALWQSLLATQELFHKVALDFAHSQQFYYDKKTAAKVQSYTQQWYNDFYQTH